MDLHDGDQRRIEVVRFRFLDIQDFDWRGISATTGIVKIGQPKKYLENFSASRVADVTMSLRSGRCLTASTKDNLVAVCLRLTNLRTFH